MTTLDHATALTTARLRPTLAFRVANAAVAMLRALRNRREVYRLGEMSDWELADIGLTRADLSVVVRSPLGIDPTARLGSIAAARAAASFTC